MFFAHKKLPESFKLQRLIALKDSTKCDLIVWSRKFNQASGQNWLSDIIWYWKVAVSHTNVRLQCHNSRPIFNFHF